MTSDLMDFVKFCDLKLSSSNLANLDPEQKFYLKEVPETWKIFFFCNPLGISIPTAFHQSLKELLSSLRKDLAAFKRPE